MAFQIEKDAEPIPGYRLVRPIGRGGFGEVWEAEAPGGIRKAIKFVFGDLTSLTSGAANALQELRSLTRVKGVRHPFLLSLERFDLVAGQLIIVTELADRDLLAHFRDCRKRNLPGIPREELLRHMEETAEVLDLMNQTHDLQHLDVKPQNLCLIHNHVKVADFGLVKDLSGLAASLTGGMTPKYAAPETFRGVVSRFSDQYSLAVVYQELLTGRAPFAATTPHEMMMAHTEGQPNLESLPPADRAAVGRALAKDPHQRHPSCLAFVRDLQGGGRAPASPFPAAVPSPAAPSANTGRPPPTIWQPPPSVPTAADRPSAPPLEAAEATGDGVLRPALVVGLGRFGLEVLRQFRAALHAGPIGSARLPHLQLLGIDVDPESADQAVRGSPREALSREDVLLAPLARVTRYIRPPSPLPSVTTWLPPKAVYRIPRNLLTGGSRALGRLAFVDNYRAIVNRLGRALDRITALEALHTAVEETGLGLRSSRPCVYVVASLAGGTGSGMFIDLAYAVRAALRERGHGRAEIIGLVLLPAAGDDPGALQARANTCAALVELRHFSAGLPFHAQYESTAARVEQKGPPLDRTVFLPAPAGTGKSPASAAGEYLCRKLLTTLGKEVEDARLFEPATLQGEIEPLLLHAAGLSALASSGRGLYWRGVRRLGQDLLERWSGASGPDLRSPVREEIQRELHARGLNPQRVVAQLEEECSRKLGKTMEDLVSGCLESVTNAAALGFYDRGVLQQGLQRVDQFLGVPEEDGSLQSAPAPLAVREAAEQLGQLHSEFFNGLIMQYLDRPGYRLAGVAEAVNHSVALLERSLQMQNTQVREVGDRVQQLGDSLRSGLAQEAVAEAGKRRGPRLEDLVKILLEYARVRCRQLVLLRARGLYLGLRGYVSDRMLEIRIYRQPLEALRESLDELGGPGAAAPAAGLPSFGSRTPDEVIDQTVRSLTSDDWLRLDQSVQDGLQGGRDGATSVGPALGSNSGLKMLRQVIAREAGKLLSGRLSWLNDPIELFLVQHPEEEDLARELRKAFDAAAPFPGEARPPGRREFSLLAAPATPAGERLLQAARRTLPEARGIAAGGQDEVVFYRECPELALEELAALGLVSATAYDRACSQEQHTPHTRIDVFWQVPVWTH